MKKVPLILGVTCCGILAYHPGIAAAQTPLTFSIVDGRTNATVLTADSAQASGQGGGVQIQQSVSEAGNGPRVWKTSVTNGGADQRWLYLRWEVHWSGPAHPDQLQYWNGRKKPVSGEGLFSASGPAANTSQGGTTMLQTIYDGSQGVALALNPREIVTDFSQSLIAKKNTDDYTLRLQIPLVLDPGKSDEFPVEVYRFKPRYGYLDALQVYYNAHPESFWARKNIDPRMAGVGSGYMAWNERSFERVRRFGGDWDWGYAPYKRSGDIYGRQQFWDYKPARQIKAPFNKFTVDEYNAYRRKRFAEASAAGVGMLYYTPCFFYCEENLAKEFYPDAIVYNPDGNYTIHSTTPNVTGYDDELLLFPWGNSYSKQGMADAAQVVPETSMTGFAYDVVNGGLLFRGKASEGLARRGFDAYGPCIDVSVGVAHMMDYTRSLEKNGKQMGLVGNPTGNSRAFTVARFDSAMYERAPYKVMDEIIPLRYNLGHKVLTWWGGYNISDMMDTSRLSPVELRAAYSGASDYVRLFSYRYGAYPSVFLTQGVPALTRDLPLLKEVITQGWQAVPAVRTASGQLPDSVWASRYGSGLGSYITVGNTNQRAWNGKIAIDNDYLGSDNYLFVDARGQSVSQDLQGRSTLIDVKLKPHEVLVLRAVASIAPGKTSQSVSTVKWAENGARAQLQVMSDLPVKAATTARLGWNPQSRAGKTWNFASPYLASPSKDLLSFPFFGASAAARNAVIVLPANATDEEKMAATHLQDYFKFWGKNGVKPSREIELKIEQGAVRPSSGQAVVYIGKGRSVARQGLALNLGSKTPEELSNALLKLLATLDRKYFYCGAFPGVSEGPNEPAVIKRAGLEGGWVPESQ